MRLFSVVADDNYCGGMAVVVAGDADEAQRLVVEAEGRYGPALAPAQDLGIRVRGPARVLASDFYQE
jgi:hypothetical protein